MAVKQEFTFHQSIPYSKPNQFQEEPLQLQEMLALIKFADEFGYSIKDAKDMKSLYDAVSSDLYSVWFAIENELSLFTHNIIDLIAFTGWERYKSSAIGNDIEPDLAVA